MGLCGLWWIAHDNVYSWVTTKRVRMMPCIIYHQLFRPYSVANNWRPLSPNLLHPRLTVMFWELWCTNNLVKSKLTPTNAIMHWTVSASCSWIGMTCVSATQWTCPAWMSSAWGDADVVLMNYFGVLASKWKREGMHNKFHRWQPTAQYLVWQDIKSTMWQRPLWGAGPRALTAAWQSCPMSDAVSAAKIP